MSEFTAFLLTIVLMAAFGVFLWIDQVRLRKSPQVYVEPPPVDDPPPREDVPPPFIPPEFVAPRQFFPILGLHFPCTRQEITAAFRRRSKELHPDHGGNPAAFRALMAERASAMEAASATRH